MPMSSRVLWSCCAGAARVAPSRWPEPTWPVTSPMSPADRFRMASVVMAVNATINVAVNDYVVTVLNQALCDR